MGDAYVREVGSVEDVDGVPLAVGVDYGTVTIGGPGSRWAWRLDSRQAETFAQLFTAACWQAAANLTPFERAELKAAEEMFAAAAPAADHEHSFPCNPPGGTFLRPGPCACGITFDHDQAQRQLREAQAALEALEGAGDG